MAGIHTGRSAMANGNIRPFRAVMIDTTTHNRLIEATAAARAIGISQKGTRNPPLTGLDDTYCAIADEVFMYYANGEENVPAELGGTVTAGDRLKVTTDGKLIAVTTDADFFVATARMGGASGDIIPVDITIGQAAA